jgi:glycosyltransferase involved in cell wall biosynthesis
VTGRLLGICPTFGRPEELHATLTALAAQTRPLDDLVVVDNGAHERTADVVAAYRAHGLAGHVHVPGSNVGPAGAIAIGLEHLVEGADDDDLVVLVDDDDPPPDRTVLADLHRFAVQRLQTSPRFGAVGLRGARLDRRRGVLHRVDGGPSGEAEVDYLWSNAFPLYRVAAIRSTPGYPAELFYGFEELEFGLRVRESGWSVHIFDEGRPRDEAPQSPAWRVGPTDWRRYYSTRNLLVILRARGRTRAAARVSARVIGKPVANLVLHPRLAMAHLKQSLSAVHHGWTGRLGCVVPPAAERRPSKPARA